MSKTTTVTCVNCGCNRFNAGDVQPHPDGGYDVIMPCADCNTPNVALHDTDPEFAKLVLSFFGGDQIKEES